MLQVAGLGVTYRGQQVLAGLSLQVAAGELVAVIGESGAGKSTLAAALAGLLPSGAVQVGSIVAPRVVPIFQLARESLSPVRKIGAQIADALAVGGQGDLQALLAAFDLPGDILGRYLGDLSGGMAQRVAIARAVACGAPLIVADEPTSALDRPNADRVLAALRQAAVQGRGVIVITHDLRVARCADRLAVLAEGRLVEVGAPAQVLASPRHPATQALCAQAVLPPCDTQAGGAEVLRLSGAGYRYRDGRGFAGLDVALRAGEVLGVSGPSGVGKTSLARVLARLVPLGVGALWVEGVEVGRFSVAQFAAHPLRGRVQYLFQEARASFDPDQPVGAGFAAIAARFHPRADLLGLLGKVGLSPEILARRPDQISVGQGQRLALVRALLAGPKVLILDEPTAALDMVARGGLVRLLAGLKAEGMAMVLISHDPEVLEALSDRRLDLSGGLVA